MSRPSRAEAQNAVKFLDSALARLDMGGLKASEAASIVPALRTLIAFTEDEPTPAPLPADASEK